MSLFSTIRTRLKERLEADSSNSNTHFIRKEFLEEVNIMNNINTQVQKTSLISAKSIGICLTGVIIAIIAVTMFNVPISTVGTAAILLACPLLHVLMMRGSNHKH